MLKFAAYLSTKLNTNNQLNQWLAQMDYLEPQDVEQLQHAAYQYPFCSLLQHLNYYVQNNKQILCHSLYPSNPVIIASFNLQNESVNNESKIIESTHQIEKINLEDDSTSVEQAVFEAPATGEYFLQQGLQVPSELPTIEEVTPPKDDIDSLDEQSLMVMMSFSEWLHFINNKTQKAREEADEQRALKSHYRRQKLAAAIEEEADDISDQVYEMAINSIAPQDNIASEALAEVYIKQGKKDKAIEMFKKLSLLNPEKNVYFAHKIENLQKEI